jgi:ribosomal protein L24
MIKDLHNTIPNLKPFDYSIHNDSNFIDQHWVLVNGIAEKKSTYVFKKDNVLEIYRKDNVIETSWNIHFQNIFIIETEDGKATVKAYLKDEDILVLNDQTKDEFALFINTSNYANELNSMDDVQDYIKFKYKQKASNLIYDHQFYYISESEEFGPFTVEELTEKVKRQEISAFCFVRDINEEDYSNRLRINDLIQEL